MRKKNIMAALRAAAPKVNTDMHPPAEVCERILAQKSSHTVSEHVAMRNKNHSGKSVRSFMFKRGASARVGFSARTLGITAAMTVVLATAAAASFVALDLPYPGKGGSEVYDKAGYVVYWRDGVLSKVIDCSKTPDVFECRGGLDYQSTTNLKILRETERMWSTGHDPYAAVLFMTDNGGLLSCAGLIACSYMKHEPNYLKPLPAVGTPIPRAYLKSNKLIAEASLK